MQGFERKNKTCWTVRQKQQESHEGENTFWDCRFLRIPFSFSFVSFTGEAVFCSNYEIHPHEKRGEITEFLVPKILSAIRKIAVHPPFFPFDFSTMIRSTYDFPLWMEFSGTPNNGGTSRLRFFLRASDFDLFRRIKRNPLRGGRWRDSGGWWPSVTLGDLGWRWVSLSWFIQDSWCQKKSWFVHSLSWLKRGFIHILYILYIHDNEMNISLYISCIYKFLLTIYKTSWVIRVLSR